MRRRPLGAAGAAPVGAEGAAVHNVTSPGSTTWEPRVHNVGAQRDEVSSAKRRIGYFATRFDPNSWHIVTKNSDPNS